MEWKARGDDEMRRLTFDGVEPAGVRRLEERRELALEGLLGQRRFVRRMIIHEGDHPGLARAAQLGLDLRLDQLQEVAEGLLVRRQRRVEDGSAEGRA
jgi:hypothetical protein